MTSDDKSFAPLDNEQKLFVAALREYSDNCTVPLLTPSCPFYELTVNGPGCGEQCHDMLADYGTLAPRSSAFDLGNGIQVHARRGRRARRGPEPTARPFDAAAIRMRDKDRTTDARHTVSLLVEINEIASNSPEGNEDVEERTYLARAYIDELVSRGFVRAELELAFATKVTSRQCASMAIGAMSGELKNLHDLPARWGEILEYWTTSFADGSIPGILARMPQLVDTLIGWNISLSPSEIAAWKPPPISIFNERQVEVSAETRDRGLWMFDRFTETYIERWLPPSLDLEWEYLHSMERGGCSSDQMKLRRTEVNSVAKIIANDAVDGRKSSARASSKTVNPSEFIPIAVEYLSSGRFAEAVTLFESLDNLVPEDAKVLNNLGFCLLPLDSDRALGALKRSETLEGRLLPVTACNMALAYFLLGRKKEALATVRRALDCEEELGAWLWSVDEDRKFTLLSNAATASYLNDLVIRIERQSNK